MFMFRQSEAACLQSDFISTGRGESITALMDKRGCPPKLAQSQEIQISLRLLSPS
jgi:hypothetical protein